VGLGGVSAAAVLAVTLPNLLDARSKSHGALEVAFKAPSGSKLALRGAGYHHLSAHAPISRPAAHRTSSIRTGPATVAPSQHFVSTAPAPPHSTPARSTQSPAHSNSGSAHSTTDGHVFLAATHSAPKQSSSSQHRGITAATLTRSQSAAHRPSGHSGGSGGGGLAGSSQPAARHHRSSSSGADASHAKSSSSRHSSSHHSSSSSSHKASASGGAGIHHSSGSSHPSGSGPSGYVNPLAHASVTPERIDQGVDYSGSGPLDALGDGKITYVGTSNTGWPGAFIEFRLLNGPDAGRYVFYAEDIRPVSGLHVGQKVNAGQQLATIYQGGSGIELGWGANKGTETYARAHGQWSSYDDSHNVATPAGKDFSALLSSLGAPPGKVEG
jgi:hypothetical protein